MERHRSQTEMRPCHHQNDRASSMTAGTSIATYSRLPTECDDSDLNVHALHFVAGRFPALLLHMTGRSSSLSQPPGLVRSSRFWQPTTENLIQRGKRCTDSCAPVRFQPRGHYVVFSQEAPPPTIQPHFNQALILDAPGISAKVTFPDITTNRLAGQTLLQPRLDRLTDLEGNDNTHTHPGTDEPCDADCAPRHWAEAITIEAPPSPPMQGSRQPHRDRSQPLSSAPSATQRSQSSARSR